VVVKAGLIFMPRSIGLLEWLYRGSHGRKSRLHTLTGTLCLSPGDMAIALGSAILRLTTGKLLDLPWITFPAIRFLKTLPRDLLVFEYGCGMSTKWYSRHFKEVHSVENSPDWFARCKSMTRDRSNVFIVLHESQTSYVDAIEHSAHREFDFVIIDGAWRSQCVSHALNHVKRGGYIILDNSDIEIEARDALNAGHTQHKKVFSGFAPGTFLACETTIWQVK
jgi:hypothetical protein